MPDMSQLTDSSSSSSSNLNPTASHGHVAGAQPRLASSSQTQSHQTQLSHDSSNDSQATNSTSNDNDRVFTPPESDSESSHRHGNDNSSSQESQLMHLSNLAALQQKIVVSRDDTEINGAQSRKRMADGVVKHTRHHSSASPVRMGHSRNTSNISIASTAGSRISELSAELKAKLSYAMVKVNNGWQSHSIDEIESLASQAASPTSSTSTLHGRHASSASPRVALTRFRQTASNPSSMTTSPVVQQPPGRIHESYWREGGSKLPSTASPVSQIPTLAPPAPIQPRQALPTNPRRSSNAKYTPAYLSHSHTSSPHTPSQPSPLQSTPGQYHVRTPSIDPILFSPPQNLREQEALETLLFMSSPGNSSNLKHAFPSPQTSQPHNGPRTSLPTSRLRHMNEANSQGRKALPTGRPPIQPKRVEFERPRNTPGGPDMDEPHGSSQARAMPRRRTINGSISSRPSLSIPVGLGGRARTKPPLGDDDVQRMIDRAAAADSSDSEDEIHLPPSSQRNRTGVGAG